MKSFKKKKILFYTENYEHGGNNRYMYDLCKLAVHQGHEAHVLSNYNGIMERELKWFKEINVDVKMIQIHTWQELRSKINVRKYKPLKYFLFFSYLFLAPIKWLYQQIILFFYILIHKFDLVVGCNGGYPAGGSVLRINLAAFLSNTPTILSVVSVPSKSKFDWHRIKFWNLITPKIVKKIIINSQTIEKELISIGCKAKSFELFYNGLENKDPLPKNHSEKIKLLFFSRLDPKKGVGHFLNVVKSFDKEILNKIEVHFYGVGSLENEIIELTKLHPTIFFYHGFFDGDIFQLFSRFDIYLLPSYMEGLPYTILEAMRASCAIIASNVGGIPELIENNKSGLLSPPGDEVQLKNQILELIQNEKLRNSLSKESYLKFKKDFELQAIYEKNINLFETGV